MPSKPIIEILNHCHPHEAVYRMKIDGLMKLKSNEFEFREYDSGGQATEAILVNKFSSLQYIKNESGQSFQQQRPNAAVMVFLSDLDESPVQKYREIPEFVDVILVPTPEMKCQLKAFTSCRIEVLIDPIDFNLSDSITKPSDNASSARPIKLVWFGYPDSYRKSMSEYLKTIKQLVDEGGIEYHIVTLNEAYGKGPFYTIHQYMPATFADLLAEFDVCIVSHMPFDFSVNTYWKSENKAVLAINRGLPVVASKTPAYERLLSRCNLQDYLFSSSEELASALHRLKSFEERKRYLDASQDIVLREYSCQRMADDWYQIYRSTKSTRKSI